MAKDGSAPSALEAALLKAVEKTFTSRYGGNFEEPPVTKREDIITWYKKMKIFGWEKFHSPTYILIIYFYEDKAAMEKQDPVGDIIFYIERKSAYSILKSIGIEATDEGVDYDELESAGDKALADRCGELAKAAAEDIKTELASLGHPQMHMSDPVSFINEVPDGIPYNHQVLQKIELFCKIGEKKEEVVVFDIVFPE